MSPSRMYSTSGVSEPGSSWATHAMARSGGAQYSPASGVSSPRMSASSVDLPQPLRPMMPIFSARKIATVASSSSTCWPRRTRALDRVSKPASGRARGCLFGVAQQVREGSGARGLALEQCQQVLRRARLAEQPPLPVVAGVAAQEFQLPLRLDALGNHFHAETASHLDDGAHDGRITGIVGRVGHEGLVDLQGADGGLQG